MSREFPGHFRAGVPVHSRNILVLLELWHGARSRIKYIISLGQEHNAFTCHFNIMNNITLVFCTMHVTIHLSLTRQASAVNGSPDLYTYWRLNCSLHTLSMLFLILFPPNTSKASNIMTVKYRLVECVVFLQKGYIFMRDLAPCHNSKSTRIFLECNKIPVLEWPGNSPEMNSIDNVLNIMKKAIGNQLPRFKEKMLMQVCGAWYSVVLNVLKELNTSMPRRIADLIKQMEVQRSLTL